MTMDRLERLSAYIDGGLDAEQMQQLERELATNPDLARELAELQASDIALRAAFAGPMNEDAPDRFMALLGESEPAQVIDFAAAREKRERSRTLPARFGWRAGAAIAATVVALLFAGSQFSGPAVSPSDAQQIAFNAALDQTPSGQQARLANGHSLSPRLSFAAKDGRFCREYADSADLGVACRGAKGWQIEAVAKGAGAATGGDEGYATAGGTGGALDAVYARLGAGDPLAPGAEAEQIARGWSAKN